MAQTQRLLTSAQVADLLGVHLRKVQRMAESGELPYLQKMPGPVGRYIFEETQVELWRYRQAEKASA